MTTQSFGKLIAIAGTLAAVAAVSVSIYLNPPSAVKAHELDQKRLQSLQQLDFAVKAYYRSRHSLPDTLNAIENPSGLTGGSQWTDPATNQPYEYAIQSPTTYRLCADFSADSGKDEERFYITFRKHHKGHDCFQQQVNAN